MVRMRSLIGLFFLQTKSEIFTIFKNKLRYNKFACSNPSKKKNLEGIELENKKFYQKQWFMWLTLVFFAPVGIFLLWKYDRFNKNARIVISVLFGLFFISVASSSGKDNNQKTVSIASQETINPTSQPTPSKTLSEEEKKKIEELRLKAEAEKVALAAKKAEEEKIGYDTGITYGQLARTPSDFKGRKVKLTGKVVQVMEGNGETQLRIAVNGDYDSMLHVVYKSNITSVRILDNDNVTIRGLSAGLLTYQSTLGGNISIPSVLVQKIDLN